MGYVFVCVVSGVVIVRALGRGLVGLGWLVAWLSILSALY